VSISETLHREGRRKKGGGGERGGVSAAVTIKARKEKGASAVLYGLYPGSSSVDYLVMQNRNLEYGGRRCGFNTKHQSTKDANV
jgi:hypothetical protein